MRLKQLLGVSLLLLITSAVAVAAGSQLTNVSVADKGSATTVILHASGAFTHTEYRPTDNLLLVDLSGVSAGKLKDSSQTVNRPGVVSYRVTGYTGASGNEVTRVEIGLAPSSVVTVNEIPGGVQVQIAEGAASKTTVPVAKATTPAPAPVAPKQTASAKIPAQVVPAKTAKLAIKDNPARPVSVRNPSVVRAKGGMDIEIATTGPVEPKVMKLTSPDRLVVDLPNSVPAGHPAAITVNSGDIKAVRIGRFQVEPPVTRVVVDLNSPRDFEVVPSAHKVTLKLRQAAAASEKTPVAPNAVVAEAKPEIAPAPAKSEAPATSEAAVAAAATPAAAPAVATSAAAPVTDTNAKATDYVFVEPKFQPKTDEVKPAVDAKAAAENAAKTVAAVDTASNPMMPPPSASMNPAAQPAPQQTPQPAVNMAQQQQQQQAAIGAPPKPKYSGEPISVNLKDVDLKDFFRLIHEISGLNIVLDPNVRGNLTLVLDDVPWDQALDIVLQNNQLDRRLEGNVLRIATNETFRKEAEGIRAKEEAQALAVPKVQLTHFLSYAHASDLMPIVKKFLSSRGDVVADPRTNSLVIQDIPSTLPAVQHLLSQLDRKTQEVEIETRVVAATRNFAREIGTQLGFGWGNGPSAVGGAGGVGTSPLNVTVANPRYFITGTQIPLFSNLPANGPTSGLSFSNASSNYRIDAILTLAESRGLLKVLSRPRITAQNNVGATVKQGVQIPVVTAAQLGGPPTTTYIAAELRMTVTPQITVENTIFMNVDVENTTPDFSRQVQGNPTLITQQATTSVLVNDGGTVVFGGVIQTQNSVNVTQVPLLGNIPVFGNLFKHTSVSTSTQELIFFITPKIVQT